MYSFQLCLSIHVGIMNKFAKLKIWAWWKAQPAVDGEKCSGQQPLSTLTDCIFYRSMWTDCNFLLVNVNKLCLFVQRWWSTPSGYIFLLVDVNRLYFPDCRWTTLSRSKIQNCCTFHHALRWTSLKDINSFFCVCHGFVIFVHRKKYLWV